MPAILVVAGYLLAIFVLRAFARAFGVEAVEDFLDHLYWVATTALIAAVGWFYWRLIGWQRGWHDACQTCEGPLGWLRPGKVWYGKQFSNFRRCWNCNRPNACDKWSERDVGNDIR